MVKKYKKPKVSPSFSLSVDDIDKNKKRLKRRIVHEDGGFTIVNEDNSYHVYNKNSKLIDSGKSYGSSRYHIHESGKSMGSFAPPNNKGGKIKTYAKGGGVRKAKMNKYG
jgi:hypothetical protein